MTQARTFAFHPYPRRTPRTAIALNVAALTALESALEDLGTRADPRFDLMARPRTTTGDVRRS